MAFDDLYNEFKERDYSNNLIDRKSEQWIFGLDKIDSLQFERADLISPRCKIFENNNIISVAFVDLYDYKTALHIFTFKKPELKPTSSFILYMLGGDGEDFWNITPVKLSPLKFKLTEEYGCDNNAITENQFLIKSREIREYQIDSIEGKISKKIIKREKNIIEIRE